jgi:hypothetical protein
MDDIPNSSGDFPAVFSGAVGRLQVAVLEACQEQGEWPARVAASIVAVVDFAAAEPESMQLLTVEALIQRPDGGRRYVRTIEHFADLLRAEAPVDERRPKSTEQALVGGVATAIADRMRHDMAGELRAAIPELVEFVLLPYVGSAEAKRWAGWAKSHSA